MSVTRIHRERVKAAIRIKHGSLKAFAEAHDLTSQSVKDLLRGQSNRAKPAVAGLLGIDPDQFIITKQSTNVEDTSRRRSSSHRLNAGVQ